MLLNGEAVRQRNLYILPVKFKPHNSHEVLDRNVMPAVIIL